MKKFHSYISYYFVNNQPIEPIYLVHKAENIKNANRNALMYILSYYRDKRRGSDFINKLSLVVKIKSKRLSNFSS